MIPLLFSIIVLLAIALGMLIVAYDKERIAPSPVPEPVPAYIAPPNDPAPWKECAALPGAVEVPLHFCEFFSDPRRILEVRSETDRLASLELDIVLNGIQRPCIMLVDEAGKLRMYDGHHRIVVCQQLGYDHLPVVFHNTPYIRGWARPVHYWFNDMINEIQKKEVND